MTTQGTFIMVDGIDGSGKSTLMRLWQDYLQEAGKRIFVLKDFWTAHGRHPEPHEIPEDTYALFSAEPTYVWTGAAIRQEMAQKNNRSYTPRAIAEAFALDRLVLYTRVLLPARARGIHVIQDRGVSTSLCYQSVHGEVSMEEIAALEGNAFALTHAPNVLLLMDVEPEVCMARLGARTDKDDNAIFEQLALQEKIDACMRSAEFTAYFTAHGTQVERFPANQEIAILQPHLRDVLARFLSI